MRKLETLIKKCREQRLIMTSITKVLLKGQKINHFMSNKSKERLSFINLWLKRISSVIFMIKLLRILCYTLEIRTVPIRNVRINANLCNKR